MAVTEKPHVPSPPLPSLSPGGSLPRPPACGWSPPPLRHGLRGRSVTLGAGRGGRGQGEVSRSLRETGGNRKRAGRGGAARRGAALARVPGLSPRVGRAAAAGAAPWAASSPAAGSSSSSSRRREPARKRRPARRRRRSTAGTSEPRYGGQPSAGAMRGYRPPWWAASCPRLLSGVCGAAAEAGPLRGATALAAGAGYGARPGRELIAPGTAVTAPSAQLSAFI